MTVLVRVLPIRCSCGLLRAGRNVVGNAQFGSSPFLDLNSAVKCKELNTVAVVRFSNCIIYNGIAD
eukprot:5633453-Amphidinium_carterae.1